jgi:hypothetical protein
VTRWFDLAPCDGDFFGSASFRYSYPIELPVSSEQVWAGLTSDEPLSWCRLLSHGRYTSERPFGVGTTRTIRAAGLLRLRERFFRWDEGRRQSFTVVQASLPMFRQFGEDYLLEPTPSGCRFTWTFAFEPGPLLKPVGPLAGPPNSVLFGAFVRDTRRHFAVTTGPTG